MTNTTKALDALERWKADTRQEIVDEIGHAVLGLLKEIGFRPDFGKGENTEEEQHPQKRRRKRGGKRAPRPNSTIGIVYRVIAANPGSRGADIVTLAAQSGQPINERTMRTALKRLKDRDYIKQINGVWFPAETEKKEPKE